jgi:hypothetical protein
MERARDRRLADTAALHRAVRQDERAAELDDEKRREAGLMRGRRR